MQIVDSAEGRDRLKAAVGCGSALSREGFLEHLFAWMFKNASPITNYFDIPPNRVVELGTRVEI